MKRTVLLLLLGLTIGLGGAEPGPKSAEKPAEKPKLTYCGSAKSDKFHRGKCEWAKKISPANLVWFASRQEAVAKGYRPCAVCKP